MQLSDTSNSAKRLKIGICHENVYSGDAICNDITGMYKYLENLKNEIRIVAQYVDAQTQENYQCHIVREASETSCYDVLIYHHSIFWELGKKILNTFSGEIIFKFHNITPSHFFEHYSTTHERVCRLGYLMTKYLVDKFKNYVWLADSEYNKQELYNLGLPSQKISVVPPFNEIGKESFKFRSTKKNSIKKIIFVGRFVPNKGHKHLIQIFKQYLKYFSEDIELHMIGSIDFQLRGYLREIFKAVFLNKLENKVRIFSAVPALVLQNLYQQGDIFLCMSEHEGFCVPIIEAQATGLPVIAGNSTAISETIGDGQLVCDFPQTSSDYIFFAELLNQVLENEDLYNTLVRYGINNVNNRFNASVIGSTFIESIHPVLEKLQ